jgi:hypothetical protein
MRVIEHDEIQFGASFRVGGNIGVHLFKGSGQSQIYREQIDYEQANQDTCPQIKRAGREGHWLMQHRIVNQPADVYANLIRQLEGAVYSAAALMDEGKIGLMSARDGIACILYTPKAQR